MKKERSRKKNPIKESLLYIVCLLPIFLSHHPDCKKFKNHTFKIGEIRLCVGCFVAYPVGIISMLFFNYIKLDQELPAHWILTLSGLCMSTTALSFTALIEIKPIKVFQKATIPIGVAFFLIWIRTLSLSKEAKVYLAMSTIGIVLLLFNLKHMYGILKSCYYCETTFAWSTCEGFERIRMRMEKFHIENLFAGFDALAQNLEKRKQAGKKLFF